MEDINQLKDDRAHKILSANDIRLRAEKENREMTAEEQASATQYLDEADGITARIESIQKAREVAEQVGERVAELSKPPKRRSIPNDSPEPKASTAQIIPMRRSAPLEAFTAKQFGSREKAEYHAYESGMYMIAEIFPASNPLKDKARQWCRDNGVYAQIQNALSTGISTGGGALVPDAMSTTIIDLRERYGIGRQWATVMPMSSDVQIVPRRVGSPSASFAGENVAITESEPTWNDVQFTAKKLGILTRISTELSEDAVISVSDYLTRDMAWAFALKEDQCIFNGDTTSTYGGINGLMNKILSSSYSAGYITVPTLTHNTFAELDATDLTTLMAALPQYARSGGRGCAWFCSQPAADLVFGRLKAAGGGNTIETLAIAGITALGERGVVGTYLGYPIVASQVLPTTTGALTSVPMLAFGNLSLAATIADRRAISFAMDASRYFDQDQIAVRCTERLDIIVHDLGDTSTAGPIVVLKGGTS